MPRYHDHRSSRSSFSFVSNGCHNFTHTVDCFGVTFERHYRIAGRGIPNPDCVVVTCANNTCPVRAEPDVKDHPRPELLDFLGGRFWP
jgi:hypothetical protein